ncbi:hypothetical protein [Streptomyces californicus]|uniref:hypothetical protein n=1 Tax=Streptomyces californicus TaxID=67351 RepID=UPI0034030DB0
MIEIPTFAAWAAANQAEGFPDEATAWAVYSDRMYRGMQALFAHPEIAENRQEAAVAEIAAVAFLESILGAVWVRERFPLADHREELGPWVQQARQRQELARRVFEFQSEPWFDDFIAYTKTNEVASAIFEADVLQTLMCMPADIARVTESGVKGQDFDILLNLAHVGDVPVEVKYKRDDTAFSEATVRNTVKGAAKQLPRGRAGCCSCTCQRPGCALAARMTITRRSAKRCGRRRASASSSPSLTDPSMIRRRGKSGTGDSGTSSEATMRRRNCGRPPSFCGIFSTRAGTSSLHVPRSDVRVPVFTRTGSAAASATDPTVSDRPGGTLGVGTVVRGCLRDWPPRPATEPRRPPPRSSP